MHPLVSSEQRSLRQTFFCPHFLATFAAELRPVMIVHLGWFDLKFRCQTWFKLLLIFKLPTCCLLAVSLRRIMSRKPLNRGAYSIEYLDSILSVLTQEVTNRNCNWCCRFGRKRKKFSKYSFSQVTFFSCCFIRELSNQNCMSVIYWLLNRVQKQDQWIMVTNKEQ